LFYTLFRNFDLGFLSMYRETPLVQDSMAVILWRLQLVARDWVTADGLPQEVFLNSVREELQAASISETVEADVLQWEVLEPLLWFGLLESDQPLDRWLRQAEPKYRKTPLFDRFLSFIYLP